jgi:hypothetical protein
MLRLERVHHVVHGEELIAGEPQHEPRVGLHARHCRLSLQDAAVGVVQLQVVVLVRRNER